MKLFVENADATLMELESVKIIGEGDIVIRIKALYREEIIKEMEAHLSEKFGRKVILLDARYGEILTLPPK